MLDDDLLIYTVLLDKFKKRKLIQWLGQIPSHAISIQRSISVNVYYLPIHASINANCPCTILDVSCECHNRQTLHAMLFFFHFSDCFGCLHAIAFWHVMIEECYPKVSRWLALPCCDCFCTIIGASNIEAVSF